MKEIIPLAIVFTMQDRDAQFWLFIGCNTNLKFTFAFVRFSLNASAIHDKEVEENSWKKNASEKIFGQQKLVKTFQFSIRLKLEYMADLKYFQIAELNNHVKYNKSVVSGWVSIINALQSSFFLEDYHDY